MRRVPWPAWRRHREESETHQQGAACRLRVRWRRQGAEDHRELLAVCDDTVQLHPPHDAAQRSWLADQGENLRARRLFAGGEWHRGGRCHEGREVAARREDAGEGALREGQQDGRSDVPIAETRSKYHACVGSLSATALQHLEIYCRRLENSKSGSDQGA